LKIGLSLALLCSNETMRFVQNDVVSFTICKKKKTQNSVVLNNTMYLFLPLTLICSACFSYSLSSTCPQTLTRPTPPHGLPQWWKGQGRQALQAALEQLHRGRPSYPALSPWLDKGRVAPTPPAHINTPSLGDEKRENLQETRQRRREWKRTGKNRKEEREGKERNRGRQRKREN